MPRRASVSTDQPPYGKERILMIHLSGEHTRSGVRKCIYLFPAGGQRCRHSTMLWSHLCSALDLFLWGTDFNAQCSRGWYECRSGQSRRRGSIRFRSIRVPRGADGHSWRPSYGLSCRAEGDRMGSQPDEDERPDERLGHSFAAGRAAPLPPR